VHGFADQGTQPPSNIIRKAYDLLAEGFGPGFNGPLLLVGQLDSATNRAAFQRLGTQVAGVPGVAAATHADREPGPARPVSCRSSRPAHRKTRPPPT
jgi:putative drug exporter of the RND superfamily